MGLTPQSLVRLYQANNEAVITSKSLMPFARSLFEILFDIATQ